MTKPESGNGSLPDRQILRALIVEDSEFDAVVLARLLRQGGYEVVSQRVQTAAAMSEALGEKEWDIVLTDHEMPEFDAWRALEVLQESGKDLPFIIVSGGIGEETAVDLMKAGAHDFLIKGQFGRLLPAVSRELREARNRQARRAAEDSLRESELRFRLLWQNSPDAILMMDARGVIVFANPAVQKVFGFSAKELEGKNLEILLPFGAAAGAEGEAPFPWMRDGGQARELMVEMVGRNEAGEEIAVEIGFSDLVLKGRKWFVAFVRDITRRRQAERALRKKEEEFRVAREIQQRLFPKNPPQLDGYDIAGASFPAAEASGDYYDFLPMLDDGVGLAVGDVSGHGMGPALIMAETRAYLRIVAMNRRHTSEVLNRANRILAEDLSENDRFVTLILGRLDPSTRRFTYSNAGHPSGYVLGADGAVRLEMSRRLPPLGMIPETTYQDSPAFELEPGDLLVLLTDGVEETEGADGRPFGMDRALDVVRTNRDRSALEIVEAIRGAAIRYSAGRVQDDDLTAVVVKVL